MSLSGFNYILVKLFFRYLKLRLVRSLRASENCQSARRVSD